MHKLMMCVALFISYLYIPFIHNLFAEMYKLIQGRGDYNAKFGVTILGTFLIVIFIFFLIYLIPTSVLKYNNILKQLVVFSIGYSSTSNCLNYFNTELPIIILYLVLLVNITVFVVNKFNTTINVFNSQDLDN